MEFIPFGDLLGYLRKMRGVKDSCYSDADHLPLAKLCTSRELMKFAIESAQGMEYLSMKKVVSCKMFCFSQKGPANEIDLFILQHWQSLTNILTSNRKTLVYPAKQATSCTATWIYSFSRSS